MKPCRFSAFWTAGRDDNPLAAGGPPAPFLWWHTGTGDSGICSLHGVLDAPGVAEGIALVMASWPDAQGVALEEKPPGWMPDPAWLSEVSQVVPRSHLIRPFLPPSEFAPRGVDPQDRRPVPTYGDIRLVEGLLRREAPALLGTSVQQHLAQLVALTFNRGLVAGQEAARAVVLDELEKTAQIVSRACDPAGAW